MPKPKKGTVLVTGGAGFIGSHVAERLVAMGRRVIVIDDLSSGRRSFVPKGAEFHKLSIGDVRTARLIEKLRPEFVFHLAAQIDVRLSVRDPLRDAETNIIASLGVLDACRRAGTKKIIFSSSGGAMFGNGTRVPANESALACPESPYGVAKRAFELYLESAYRVHGLRYVALRYANVYGPRQGLGGEAGVVGLFSRALLEGRTPKIFGDGKQTRDFVYVSDVVDANIRAMRSSAVGVYHVGTGIETSVNALARSVCAAVGHTGRLPHGPAGVGDVRRSALDARLAKKVLGWTPKVRLAQGILRTVAWFKTKG